MARQQLLIQSQQQYSAYHSHHRSRTLLTPPGGCTSMKMAYGPQCRNWAMMPRGTHTSSRFIQLEVNRPRMALASCRGEMTPALAHAHPPFSCRRVPQLWLAGCSSCNEHGSFRSDEWAWQAARCCAKCKGRAPKDQEVRAHHHRPHSLQPNTSIFRVQGSRLITDMYARKWQADQALPLSHSKLWFIKALLRSTAYNTGGRAEAPGWGVSLSCARTREPPDPMMDWLLNKRRPMLSPRRSKLRSTLRDHSTLCAAFWKAVRPS